MTTGLIEPNDIVTASPIWADQPIVPRRLQALRATLEAEVA